VSWLKYLWATLIGFVVTVAVATSSATLILWLDFSRYVEPVSHGLVLGIDLGIWYGILVVAVCIFIGLFAGTFVGTTVGIHFYRRHQNSKPATTNSKPGH
jgi:ABC-type Mn2+/Zn2+ transport system permease subunit